MGTGRVGKAVSLSRAHVYPAKRNVGELEKHNDYNAKQHKWEKSIENSFFNKRFWRSNFDKIVCSRSVSDSVNYSNTYRKATKRSSIHGD